MSARPSPPAPGPPLVCPVRGCGLPLVLSPREARCPRGHGFDRARSGYLNLTQPQDKASADPGDAAPSVAARRRLFERGLFAPLVDAVGTALVEAGVGAGAPLVDLGCGEGTVLSTTSRRLGVAGIGVDLSRHATLAAARRYPTLTWIVANADRRLPLADAAFGAVLSVTARKNGPELARLLAPGGVVLVVVPAADDQIELRAEVMGRGIEVDRVEATVAGLRPHLSLRGRSRVSTRASLERDALVDMLAGAYRGARNAAGARIDALGPLDVTLAWELLLFGPG